MEEQKKPGGSGSSNSRSSSSLHLLYAYGFWTQIPILRVVPREETQGESQILVNLWGFFTKEKNESWSRISRKYVLVLQFPFLLVECYRGAINWNPIDSLAAQCRVTLQFDRRILTLEWNAFTLRLEFVTLVISWFLLSAHTPEKEQ